MQEIKNDGSSVLTDHPDLDRVLEALKEEATRTVALHKPGTIITQPSGTKYWVRDDGSWERLPECPKAERLAAFVPAEERVEKP